MRLEVRYFHVKEVVFSHCTRYARGVLEVNRDDLLTLALKDNVLRGVDIQVAYPGESTRIIHVLDTVEPRWKAQGKGCAFPGFLGPPETVGSGVTHVLSGLAVMETALLPWDAGGLLIPREAIVDMRGPAAALTPFSTTINLVLSFELASGGSDVEYDSAIRLAGLRISEFLARCTQDGTPDRVACYHLDERAESSLPRVAYIHQLQSQGVYASTFVYGRHVFENLPTLLHPNELLDGAVVSGNYVYGAFKTPTYLHCRNPVVGGLLAGHGRDHIVLPVIISRGHNYSFTEKLRSAQYAAKLAQLLHADGVVMTWEGGGNSIIDAMQTVRACEQAGIRTVVISNEMSVEGAVGVSLLDSVPEATAIVSAGSTEQSVQLPKMERVLGGTHLRLSREFGGEQVPAEGPLKFDTLHQIYCAANHMGFGNLTCRSY